MRNLKKALFAVLTFALVAVVGCGPEEASGPSISSIQLRVTPDVFGVTETSTSLTFVAVDQNTNDISDVVSFYVNGSEISSNTYTPSEVGAISVEAKYESISSSAVDIAVINPVESISIEADKTTVKPNGTDVVTLTATDQLGLDITAYVTFIVNGRRNETGNLISTDVFENLEIEARYKTVVSEPLTVEASVSISSMTLTIDRTAIPADSYSEVKMTVLDQDNDDVTSAVTFLINGSGTSEKTFISGNPGDYQIQAQWEGITSNTVNVTVDPFTVRKVLVEEFTGEWCGWCPEAAYNLENLVKDHPYVLTVGIHNGDGLEFNNEDVIRNAFGLNFFPSGLTGRVNLTGAGYNSSPMDNAITDEIDKQLYEETVLAGLGINTTLNGDEVDVDVTVDIYEDISQEIRLTIYLIENNRTSGVQENYFSGRAGFENYHYYSQPSRLTNYVHQFVLRKAGTDILGDVIPSESVSQGARINMDTRTISLSGYDVENCHVIAFVHYPMNGQKTIINAEQVKVGESIGGDR